MNDPPHRSQPRVSIIIPSLDGHRGGAVPRLLESIKRQTLKDLEIHLIRGVSPQGKAINQGAGMSRGEILVILDDDSCLAGDDVLERLVAALDADPATGMAGASIVVPPDATPFQRRAAKQFPRFNTPVVDQITDSDYACHGCCAIPASVFKQVGCEREDLLRGLDPDLRVRLRTGGYRVVLVPHAAIYHPLPDGWGRLMRIFFRNGYGSAYARKFQPGAVYETHEALDARSFKPRRSFAYRLGRFPLRLAKALVQGRFLRFSAYCAYACGYAWGAMTARENAHAAN
ncbi:MAG: glycosyltransferase [Candidatus Hydrogenedentes bacterium]|nr:glycosyltransferase [Candidatus Hydrogenedentota bacterium]